MLNTSSDSALTGFLAGRADSNNCCNGNNGNGMGWGNDGWWVLILLFAIFGWGRNGWGNGDGNNGGGMNYVPYAVGSSYTDASLQRGFDTQSILGKLDGISNGICSLGYDQLSQMNNLGTAISSGFAGVNNAICNLGYEQAQLNNATNVAIMQGNNALQSQLAQCLTKIFDKAKKIFSYNNFAVGTCAA